MPVLYKNEEPRSKALNLIRNSRPDYNQELGTTKAKKAKKGGNT
jgi:hypothetical protein